MDCVCVGTVVEGNGADCVCAGTVVEGNGADCAGTGVEGNLPELSGIETKAGTELCGTEEGLID